jgi:glutamate---cysteine ligase / carboxylate-amine ligase
MRTVGVEEEMLLVDATTAVPIAVAEAVVQEHSATAGSEQRGGRLDFELQQQMIETDTSPVECLAELAPQLRRWRLRADELARVTGARVAALATSPLPVAPETTVKPRYGRMVEHFGLTALEQLTCGCHVHVSIDSPDEGVAVLDRIRVWLPVLLALSANSPFWQGTDSGYASFRSQVWHRFPTAGPSDVFGSTAAYFGLVEALLRSGVSLDHWMIYFDARLSANYPTVEVRVADVCLDVNDTVLVAALVRGLVETAAREWRRGDAAPRVPTALLAMANWRAARSALDGDLLDPITGQPRPAGTVVDSLHAHVAGALRDSGDDRYVAETLGRLLARGPGAAIQRARYAETGDLRELTLRAAEYTIS